MSISESCKMHAVLLAIAAGAFVISIPRANAAMLVTYDFTGPSASPTSVGPGLTSATSFTGQFGAETGGFGVVTDGGQDAAWNDGTAAAHTEADAKTLDGGYYWQFTVTPAIPLNLTALDFDFGGERGGGGNTGFTAFYDAQYSLDGFATAGISVGTGSRVNGSNGNGYALQAIDLTGVAGLQSVSTAVTFRFYTWHGPDNDATLADATSQETRFDNVLLSDDVVPEPASLALLVIGGLMVMSHRRKS